MTKREFIEDALTNLNEADLLDLWNSYVDSYGTDDQHIYEMSEFDDEGSHYTPTELLECTAELCTSDDYFTINGYGEFESFCDIYDIADDDLLIDYIIDNDDDNGTGILDDWEEYDDKEEE